MKANPQVEEGYIQIATGSEENDVLLALVSQPLTASEYKCMLFVIRKTWGYKKKEDWISLSQFQKATHLSRPQICNSLSSLVKCSLLVKRTLLGKVSSYSPNKHFNEWKTLVKQSRRVKHSLITSKVEHNPLVKRTLHTKETITKETITKENNTNVLQKVEYGNPNINEALSYMKERLGLPILDDSVQVNRNYTNLLLKKFGGIEKLKLLIDATATNDFWSTRITSMKTLYYKGVNIISSNRDVKNSITKL